MQLCTNAGAWLSFYLPHNALPTFCWASHLQRTGPCLTIYRESTQKPWTACTGQSRAAARTRVEEQDDRGLRGGHDHVDGVALEVAPDVGVAGVVVPGQLPVLHRRLIELLHTHLKDSVTCQAASSSPPSWAHQHSDPKIARQAHHVYQTAHNGCPIFHQGSDVPVSCTSGATNLALSYARMSGLVSSAVSGGTLLQVSSSRQMLTLKRATPSTISWGSARSTAWRNQAVVSGKRKCKEHAHAASVSGTD